MFYHKSTWWWCWATMPLGLTAAPNMKTTFHWSVSSIVISMHLFLFPFWSILPGCLHIMYRNIHRTDEKRYPIHLGICDLPITCKLFLQHDYLSTDTRFQIRKYGPNVLHQNLGKQQIQMVSWLSNTKMLRNHKPSTLPKGLLTEFNFFASWGTPHRSDKLWYTCKITSKWPIKLSWYQQVPNHVQNLHRTVLLHKTIPMYRITS